MFKKIIRLGWIMAMSTKNQELWYLYSQIRGPMESLKTIFMLDEGYYWAPSPTAN